jgi:hypothetical protein
VADAGLHPEQLKGVINFVGGWSGLPRVVDSRRRGLPEAPGARRAALNLRPSAGAEGFKRLAP